ncbi:polysaccharide deacetylase family protein [Tateyamaria omphalii]|uniref:polysaccharide deacetylase family protein n=1 Tax=Tateyamaria omphalii TaxID=299262 RepID=UPI001C994C82|nr:polysaccharide deacetylase family protein [Tateyamaria omphalii]MBY5935258.1 polysaccharide deacetylase family protein [Tateyamaria omphalii]
MARRVLRAGAFMAVMFASFAGAVSAAETRRISFSFDDAPRGDGPLLSGAERTEKLVAGLANAGIEGAAFFVLTQSLAHHRDGADRLRTYTDAGHVLANHTHTHPRLRETDPDSYLADIDRAAAILEGFDNVAPYFRFPYLDEGDTRDKRLAVVAGLAARGLQNAYVTVDTYDWYMQALVNEAVEAGHPLDMDRLGQVYVEVLIDTIEFYDALAVQTLGRHPDHVLLLHENDLAALFVEDLAGALREDGWVIVPAIEAYTDEIARVRPDTQFNGQGRIAAIAHAAGVAPRQLVSPGEDEDRLRAAFVARGLLPVEGSSK